MARSEASIRQEFDRELTKAHERVTRGKDGEPGWLIRFVQLDLNSLTPSEWMVFAYEVAAFVETGFSGKHTLPLVSATGWAMHAMPGETEEYTLPSRKEAESLQRTIHQHLHNLWNDGMTPVTFKELTLMVTQPGVLNQRHGAILVTTKPKTKEFEYRVALVLEQHGGRIRSCEECHRIFLAIRRDQLFCDPHCQMRVASRKWRTRNIQPKKKEQAHGTKRR